MVEMRNEDQRSFHNFMRMQPAMLDEIVERLTPRITKQTTNWRPALDPGLKVALTLRHLAAGAKYKDMQYAWRVPHNTISLVVREVCRAILEEYLDKQMKPPTTEEGWRQTADEWYKRWNFPHAIGAIDGKHVACSFHLILDQNTRTTRSSLVSYCLPGSTQITSLCRQMFLGKVPPLTRTSTTTVM